MITASPVVSISLDEYREMRDRIAALDRSEFELRQEIGRMAVEIRDAEQLLREAIAWFGSYVWPEGWHARAWAWLEPTNEANSPAPPDSPREPTHT